MSGLDLTQIYQILRRYKEPAPDPPKVTCLDSYWIGGLDGVRSGWGRLLPASVAGGNGNSAHKSQIDGARAEESDEPGVVV